MLGILDQLSLGSDPLSPQTIHPAVEAKKLAFADRAAYLTDPLHMRIQPEKLIDPAYLKQRSSLIDLQHTSAVPLAGSFTGDTIYLCTADREGNVVSLIQSNYMGFGSGLVVDGTGIVLQNRGAYFSLDPQAANALAPNKRTLHTLIPSLALRDGKPAMVFGTMGGDGQPQTHLQFYSATAHFGLNIQQAIEMPRWIHGAPYGGNEEVLLVEERFPDATIQALRQIGHNIQTGQPWLGTMGYAQGIIFDSTNGVMHGGSDPRAEGIAAGW
ncbi:hypothetical protein KDW_45020 [Dictyobacter vulcani]|uniref:Gamma-glutamyltranspeptidase n=1 Tax=Dictyobacter vulcani TaxID=2607529 RepID=A0A5J4KV08_9CHLR|nr:hypothetical protein KDW_45020 [Dictyobacter vulcani]